MTTGSLTAPWPFKKYQADWALKHPRRKAAFSWPAIPPAGCWKAARLCEPTQRGPTPSNRPPEGRLLAGGPSCPRSLHLHKCDETGRGYSMPCQPKSRAKRDHSASYQTEISHPAQHFAMLRMTSPLSEGAMLPRRAVGTVRSRRALPVSQRPEGGKSDQSIGEGGRHPAGSPPSS